MTRPFFFELFGVVALPSVFLFMELTKRNALTPRSPIGREPSTVAVVATNIDLTASTEVARTCAPAPNSTQPLVHYFDPYGGFSRVGRVIASHVVVRGKRKGTVVLTIATMPNGQVIRNSDEVELVKGPHNVKSSTMVA